MVLCVQIGCGNLKPEPQIVNYNPCSMMFCLQVGCGNPAAGQLFEDFTRIRDGLFEENVR